MNVKSQPLVGRQDNGTGLVNALQVKTGTGTLASLLVFNTSGSAQYIQLHDAASAPADTAVPLFAFAVPANSQGSLDIPVKFTNGIYLCNSSTAGTKTIGAADCFFLTRDL